MNPLKTYNGYSVEELRKQLLVETDSTSIKEITDILNAHLQKKDIIRKTELSDLQDKIQKQMEKRIDERADCFDNKVLLDYFKTIDDTISKIDSTDIKPIPQIKVTNQQLNINLDKPTMSRDEKLQVVDAVKAILERVQNEQLAQNNNIIEAEYKNVDEQQ